MNTSKNLSKRNVGGKRVICQCDFRFPKVDVFSHTQAIKSGVLVFNVRGGSFYCTYQFNEETIKTVFEPDQPTKLPTIVLKPSDAPIISLDNYQARFVHFNREHEHRGMVFRFVHQTEQQLDTLNLLTDSLPCLEENEEQHVNALMTG